MIWLRAIIGFCFFVTIFTGTIFSAASFNRLITLIDEIDEDSSTDYALRDLLARAIQEQAAPILVTRNVLLAFLKKTCEDRFVEEFGLFRVQGSQYLLIVPEGCKLLGFNTQKLANLSELTVSTASRRGLVRVLNNDTGMGGLAELDFENLFLISAPKVRWNVCMFGHGEAGGRIAGTNSGAIKRLFNFLNTEILVNFVYMTSCFLGGFNKTLLLPSSGGVYSFVLVLGSSSESRVVVNELTIQFNAFFDAAEQSSMRSDGALKRAIQHITCAQATSFSAHGLSSLPQVYDGCSNTFKPLVDKRVSVLYGDTTALPQKLRSASKPSSPKSVSKNPYELDDKVGVLLMSEQYEQPIIVTPAHSTEQFGISVEDGHLNLIPVLSSLSKHILEDHLARVTQLSALKSAIHDMKVLLPGKKGRTLPQLKQIFAPQDALFPAFLSMSSNQRQPLKDTPLAVHYFAEIRVRNNVNGMMSPFFGVAQFLRDSFMDAHHRDSVNLFLIERLSGFNDFLPILEIYSYVTGCELPAFAKALRPYQNEEIEITQVLIRTEGLIESDEMSVAISFSFENASWSLSFTGKPEDFSYGWCWNFSKEPNNLANIHRYHKAKRHLSKKISK